MPADAVLQPDVAAPVLTRRLVRRHGLVVRITHWINAAALFVMLCSGLQIFNAHPQLYWGQKAVFARPWAAIGSAQTPSGPIGVTMIGSARFKTTGVLGLSRRQGVMENRAFPAWATIPGRRNLAYGRRWHFAFAWIFVVNGLVYVATSLLGRHFRRDLWPTAKDLRDLPRDVLDHARLRFPRGWEATRYHVLQKISYVAAAFVAGPLMVLTGLTMSPAMDAAFPVLLDLFGGRQSARTIHFLCAAFLVLFVIVHLAMVLLTGPFNQVRGMVTGRYAIKVPEGEETPR